MDTSDATTDSDTAEPTVLSRMLAAGISRDQILADFESGRIRLNGEPITSLEQPAPRNRATISISLP